MINIDSLFKKSIHKISDSKWYYLVNSSKLGVKRNISGLVGLLSAEEQQKYNRLRIPQDRRSFLCARLILRNEFKNHYNISFDEPINFNNFGKPVLLKRPDINFNITHCNDYVAVGFSELPIGVDLENVVNYDKKQILELSRIVYHSSEVNLLNQSSLAKAQYLFTKLWSIKESIIKAMGKGFYIDTKTFVINDILSDSPYLSENIFDNFTILNYMINDEMTISISH